MGQRVDLQPKLFTKLHDAFGQFFLFARHQQRDILGDRQSLKKRKMLEHHTDAQSPRNCRGADLGRLSPPLDCAFVWRFDPVDQLHQGRLASAVLSENRMNCAWHDVEVHARIGVDRTVALGDATQREKRLSHRSAWQRCCHALDVPVHADDLFVGHGHTGRNALRPISLHDRACEG